MLFTFTGNNDNLNSTQVSNKKGLPIIMIIIAIIIGSGIIKEFDFENLRFEKPALAAVYVLTFLGCIYFIVKNIREK